MARARVAVTAGGLLLLAIGGGAWWLLDGIARPPRLAPILESPRSDRPLRAAPPGVYERTAELPRDEERVIAPQRATVDRSPLELPADDEIAALESRGRLLLAGRVIDFDGAPCPGAVLWHRGTPIATSDAAGGYRIEVARLGWGVRGHGASESLAAVKEGVGAGSIEVGDVSRQVDLPLQWRARFGGTTVELGSDRIVPDATVELLAFIARDFPFQPTFRLTTRSDANGAFEFVGIPPYSIALRAESESHASAGWFTCDTRDGSDHLGVPFRMMHRVRVRGWFVPPPAGARLVLLPDLEGEVVRELEKFEAPIDDEGRFDVRIAASMDCRVRLQIDDAPLWSGKFEVPIDAFEVDLGRIEVAEPGVLEVELALPDEVLELGFEVRLQSVRSEFGELRRPIGRDGRARVAPLDQRAQSLAIGFAGGVLSFASDQLPPLLPGETRRWRLAGPEAGELWIVGRVTDRDGTPAVGVDLRMLVPYEGAAYELRAGAISDAAGRFALVADARGANAFLAPGRSIELLARGRRGVRRLEVASALPAAGTVRRLDVVLEPVSRLHGRVVDAKGQPVGDVSLTIAPSELAAEDVRFLAIDFIAANDGTFQVDGLEARDHRVWLDTRNGRIDVGRIDRATITSGRVPVTLTLPANWNE
ncbi:MAG: carboxypeptidase regulatory-like domain-containing protein [Planctomycetes bacterium]|nr:carboxypeptidase regulatory-like domain-containing protein [Planctomycetota bacterium]